MFRTSTSSDLNDIRSLVFKCYGDIDLKGWLDDLDGKYMLRRFICFIKLAWVW